MAFTGVAVVQSISDTKVRITGLSLAGGAAGTIGLDGNVAAGVQLPNSFRPGPYRYNGAVVDLSEAIEVSIWRAGAAGAGLEDVVIAKADDPFLVTLTNADAQNASSDMEIYLTFHE